MVVDLIGQSTEQAPQVLDSMAFGWYLAAIFLS